MYLVFFALWIIFNGRITTEIVILGLIISAAVYSFICKFMDFGPKNEIKMIKKLPVLFQFLFQLIIEIVKANFATMKFITTSDYEIEPVLIQFESNLKTESARFLLANAITMTPGTITVAIDGSCFYVHCLDKTMGEGIENSEFVKLLRKLEA